MHNLGTVIKFEVSRMLKKPSFWLMALGFPILMAAIFGIVFWSNQATMDAQNKLKDQKFSIVALDESKLVKPEAYELFGVQKTTDKQSSIDKTKDGSVDAFFYFPKDLAKQKVEIYGRDVGIFENSRYSAVVKAMLDQSVDTEVSLQQRTVLQGHVAMDTTMFREGKEYDGFREMILPGLFLVLFYILIGFFGGQMLNSTIEEKENRTIEMLLTTLKADTLIVGKILALIALALIQTAVILIPILTMYLLAGSQLQIPNIDLSSLPVDLLRIGLGALIFTFSFLMFTGILVAVGSAMPTAKEASQWFGFVIMFLFGPLYGVTAFISYPDSPFVQFLTLFPLTAPIPLMLRNAVGNLPVGEALLGVLILAVTTVLVMMLAVRIFRYGAMQYDSKISLSALRTKRKAGRVKS